MTDCTLPKREKEPPYSCQAKPSRSHLLETNRFVAATWQNSGGTARCVGACLCAFTRVVCMDYMWKRDQHMVWLQSMSSSLTDALVSTFNQAIINTEFKHEFGIQQCVSSSFEKKKKEKKYNCFWHKATVRKQRWILLTGNGNLRHSLCFPTHFREIFFLLLEKPVLKNPNKEFSYGNLNQKGQNFQMRSREKRHYIKLYELNRT